jgi:hypothetical protein
MPCVTPVQIAIVRRHHREVCDCRLAPGKTGLCALSASLAPEHLKQKKGPERFDRLSGPDCLGRRAIVGLLTNRQSLAPAISE